MLYKREALVRRLEVLASKVRSLDTELVEFRSLDEVRPLEAVESALVTFRPAYARQDFICEVSTRQLTEPVVHRGKRQRLPHVLLSYQIPESILVSPYHVWATFHSEEQDLNRKYKFLGARHHE